MLSTVDFGFLFLSSYRFAHHFSVGSKFMQSRTLAQSKSIGCRQTLIHKSMFTFQQAAEMNENKMMSLLLIFFKLLFWRIDIANAHTVESENGLLKN